MTATTITEMVYDRPMNLSSWITSDGRAYAVQKVNTIVCTPLAPECVVQMKILHREEYG